jgi:hypothetical protein
LRPGPHFQRSTGDARGNLIHATAFDAFVGAFEPVSGDRRVVADLLCLVWGQDTINGGNTRYLPGILHDDGFQPSCAAVHQVPLQRLRQSSLYSLRHAFAGWESFLRSGGLRAQRSL